MADKPNEKKNGQTEIGTAKADSALAMGLPPEVAVHDRIMDAYYGKMGEEFMRKTQERVHWVCASVRGERILDVGCSQGIVPILLGREGKQVVGLDTDAEAIAVAEAHVSAGPAHVKDYVRFVIADFMGYDFSGQSFDTVIMSEVLEHLVDPGAFVAHASRLLVDGGTLVVTLPFGINDFIDHKRTYYLVEAYELLARFFEVSEVELFGKWIGFRCVRRSKAVGVDAARIIPFDVLVATEKAFNALERTLVENLKKSQLQLKAANDRVKDITQKLSNANAGASAAATEAAAAASKLAVLEARHAAVVEAGKNSAVERDANLERIEKLSREVESRKAECDAAMAKVRVAEEALERERKAAANRLGELEAESRRGRDDVTTKLRAAEALLEHERKVAADLRANLERERDGLMVKLDVAQEQLRHEQEAKEARLGVLEAKHAQERDEALVQLRAAQEQLARERDDAAVEKQRADESQEALRQAVEREHDLRDRLLAQVSEAERLQQDLADRTKAYEDARVQIMGLNQRTRTLEAEAESFQRELAETQRLLSVERSRATELDASLKDCQAAVRRAEKSRDKATSTTTQYQRWLMESRASVYFIQHTVAFQLGCILTFAFRSPRDFLKTPLRLARLIAAAWRRGPDGRPGHVFIPDLPTMSASFSPASVAQSVPGPVTPQSAGMKVRSHASQHRVSVKVDPGNEVVATAVVRYPDGVASREKHAVAMLHAFDSAGKAMEASVPGFRRSERLKGVYRYLGCTGGVSKQVLRFRVPQGVARIEIEVRPFNLPQGLQLDIGELIVETRPAATSPVVDGDDLTILGWPECQANGKPVVMAVMDEFTTGCFENDLALILPRPDNWRALAEKYKPEMFFIESAWKGNGGSWQYRVAEYANRPGEEIADMALYASTHGIPLVFWNKEDPVHHQKFMVTAKLADHIFTTDANMCDSYREKTGNPSAHALPFAAQPALHFPAVLEGRRQQSCFAGSWYGDRHEARGECMRWLLRAGNRHGLVIYDRNHGSGNFTFPEEYHPAIRGGLPYKELCAEYRNYRVFLNVNSVTDSPTMFSRRVFELMACGTPVISTQARGIEELFQSKAVWLVDSEEQADEAIRILLADDVEWRRRSLLGIRDVFANHTYAHRLNQLFEQSGLATRLPVDPCVLLLAEAASQGELERLIDIARAQRYPDLRVRIAAPVAEARSMQWGSTKVSVVPTGQLIADGVDAEDSGAKAIGWISASANYGPGYVRDLANAMAYRPEAHGWGKAVESDAFAYGRLGQLQASVWRPEQFPSQPEAGALARPLSNENFFIVDRAEYAPAGERAEILEG